MKKSHVLIISLLNLAFAYTQKHQEFNQSEFIWDLSEIYKTDDTWREDYTEVKKVIDTLSFGAIQSFENSKHLSNVLEELSIIRNKTSKVAFYAILRWEEGKVPNGPEFLEKGEGILMDFEALLAELEGKILVLNKDTLINWLKSNDGLIKHRHWLNQIIDQKDHRSTPEVEYALRKTRGWISSSIDSYWEIQAMDKLWPIIQDENGEDIMLNRSAFRKIRNTNNIQFRDRAAKKYYESLDAAEGIMGELYTRKIKSELDLAELRGFSDGIDANWFFYGGCPEGTYKTLIGVAKSNKEVLQRYAKLRGQVLSEGALTYLDFYKTPDALNDYKYNFNTSMNIALKASKQIGSEFHNNMKTAFENKHWMHLADVPKTARYHIRPPVTGVHPYFILKYEPNVTESRALVGGLFSMATDISSIGADGIDVFETEAPIHISGTLYAGDIFFDKLTASQTTIKKEKIAHLLQLLEFLRRFFKNAILMELDSTVQQMLIDGERVSGSKISEVFLKLLEDYYGAKKGIMEIPKYLKNDWMTESAVLFMPKYEHHYWAPSLAVGAAMVEDKTYSNLYLSPYKEDRYDSYSVLKREGFDLTQEESYGNIIDLMNRTMDEIERELKD
ncbi:hypothetical protein J0X14_11410 [Muricauda sp. CAU 1633]|uniref:hypothetical protein n=1 Tax=Allomuricauda sp. CAU 1633 TaxID=2816036 RepID=UPI001A8D2BA3|nr:hypothetical protein [Muricauda sp. CAU 1633]MBO0322905.1 hypothetical protein [Muricauda sp. CAU 1633]